MSGKKKRTVANANLMPVKSRRPPVKSGSRSRWGIIKAILERTRAGRAVIDEIADGADMTSSKHLPVMVTLGGARKRGKTHLNC